MLVQLTQYAKHLPPYRSLLLPELQYDYALHSLVPRPSSRNWRLKKAELGKMRYQLLFRLDLEPFLDLVRLLMPKRRRFTALPSEIQDLVFLYLDEELLRTCLYVLRSFYKLSKPHFYKSVSFSLTYRLAQFVTILRIMPSNGVYVRRLDLSELRAGNCGVDGEEEENLDAVLAGWRDWKYANNPLYTMHPAPPPAHVPPQKQDTPKLRHYFKKKRRIAPKLTPKPKPQPATLTHPKINRYLANYTSSKDVPVGHLVHILLLCPHIEHLNLNGLSLSADYALLRPVAQRYEPHDLMHNHHKDIVRVLEALAPSLPAPCPPVRPQSPQTRYNSLLPPLPVSVLSLAYLDKGDGKVFLLDLNLRSISEAHLEIISEKDVLLLLERRSSLTTLCMRRVIWINAALVSELLRNMLAPSLSEAVVHGEKVTLFRNCFFELAEFVGYPNEHQVEPVEDPQGRVIVDLLDAGMCKNLLWAQRIDTGTRHGRRVVHKILNKDLLSEQEATHMRNAIERGRPGENFFW